MQSQPRSVRIAFVPPGTGKTTRLLDEVDSFLTDDVAPNKIGFVSFTRKATQEARDRAVSRFGFQQDDLCHFRTLHATAFHQLGLTSQDVMDPADYKTVAE